MSGMGPFVGNKPVTGVYVGSIPVPEVYVGSHKIWPTKEKVQITLGYGYEAAEQLLDELWDRGLDEETVTEIPFDIELVGTGTTQGMFHYYESLTRAPAMDTSNVTSMVGMFESCESLVYVPDMHTSNVTDMSWMFYDCWSLTDGNVRLLGRHPDVYTEKMIENSGLTREPFYDPDPDPDPDPGTDPGTDPGDGVVQITLGSGLEARDQLRAALTDRGLAYSTVTEIPFEIMLVGTGSTQRMFGGCAALTSVPEMNTSQVTKMSYMFDGCSSLTQVPAMATSQVTNMEFMFYDCVSLTTVPAMATSQVTNMNSMFGNCESLTYVPAMNTSGVTAMIGMFFYCMSLTDGNVRLITRHPQVETMYMLTGSGLTREPFYNSFGDPI